MNVLLTCAGRRNYLVKFFQEALRGRGQVFAADASPDAPALAEADRSFLLPPLNGGSYIDALLTLCHAQHVRLLIPLNDLELPLLATHRARFLQIGTFPLISSPEVVDTCFDKWGTFNFLKASGLDVPESYLSLADAAQALSRREISFPLVVKPRWGTASVGVEYADDEQELQLSYAVAKNRIRRTFLRDIHVGDPDRCVLIQKRVYGQEYGLDVVNDLSGQYCCAFVKKKLAMRAGETDRAVAVRSERLEALAEIIGRRLGHVGLVDCDVILNEDGCYVLDLNPRFGGGYPFSHVAGANLPAALLAWARQERPEAAWLSVEPDVLSSKCDGLVVMHQRTALKAAGDARGRSR
jgi:carbamoyl-phosphate synthase large subunit